MKKLVGNPIIAMILVIALIISLGTTVLSGIALAASSTTADTTAATTSAPADVAPVETAPVVEEPVISDPVVDPVIETAPADTTTPVVDPVVEPIAPVAETPAPAAETVPSAPADTIVTPPAKVESSATTVVSTATSAATVQYCGVVTFTSPTAITVAPGGSIPIAGSYDGSDALIATGWWGGDGVAYPFDFTMPAPSTPGVYPISMGSVNMSCPRYVITVTVEDPSQLPVDPEPPVDTPTDPGQTAANTAPTASNPDPTPPAVDVASSQPVYSELPVTGVNLLIVMMYLLTFGITGAAMRYGSRWVGNKTKH